MTESTRKLIRGALILAVCTLTAVFILLYLNSGTTSTPTAEAAELEPATTVVATTTTTKAPKPAVRLNNARQVTDTIPPPEPLGIHNLPFAPANLDGCDRAEFYAAQFGLDTVNWRHLTVRQVIFRESSCRNDVRTWCCYGYFQIHEIHIGSGSLEECGVDEIEDFFGAEPLDRQRNACMAARVHRQQGPCAWDVVGC